MRPHGSHDACYALNDADWDAAEVGLDLSSMPIDFAARKSKWNYAIISISIDKM